MAMRAALVDGLELGKGDGVVGVLLEEGGHKHRRVKAGFHAGYIPPSSRLRWSRWPSMKSPVSHRVAGTSLAQMRMPEASVNGETGTTGRKSMPSASNVTSSSSPGPRENRSRRTFGTTKRLILSRVSVMV